MISVGSEIFAQLDCYTDRIPLEVLVQWLHSTSLGVEEVGSYLRFHSDRYMRNLMYYGPAYQALVLCWRNGQRSPIHDHIGSSCGVKVLRGTALETVFETGPNGMIYPSRTMILEEGSITGSQDNDIHQVSNLQAEDADLVTLHIYSPALYTMNIYSLLDGNVNRFDDPVNDEFVVGGAGI
ncbi:MAG: cysteine dioxygenase family protein [Gemmataceae bacterium]